METPHWIWQDPGWPHFVSDLEQLLPRLAALNRLLGALEVTCRTLAGEELLDARERALTEDALETSAIEGEILRRSSVRASIRKRLGLPVDQDDSTRQTDALTAMVMDARERRDAPLTEEKLFAWHAALFPTSYSGLRKIRVSAYRGEEQMQIVSGPMDRETIHYIAPPEDRIAEDMRMFQAYLATRGETDPLLQAGVAHLWFIMIHPFDDGNGRIARAIADSVLSSHYWPVMQIVSLSRQISLDRKGYYATLEQAGKNGLDITPWLLWFLATFAKALQESQWIIDRIVSKVHFWQQHRETHLNERQHKVLNRLLDQGERFTGGMSTRKYAGMTKCSKVTASRDLSDLEKKGILRKRPGGGRSTSYDIVSATAPP